MNVRTALFAALFAASLFAPSAEARHWVWFMDKGVDASGAVISAEDAPVWEPYVSAANEIAPVHVRTRWFNGVSVTLSDEPVEAARQFRRLEALPFVRSVEQVGIYKSATERPPSHSEPLRRPGRVGALDYGGSYQQIAYVAADQLHAAGYDGLGITIAVFDNGFVNYRSHPAFAHLDVAATWDVVDDDASVDTATTDQVGSHGTEVLGCVGGYAPGSLVGTAWNATFLLARTETYYQEMPFEEDNWAAAAEWAYMNGADIITTSVGYNWFDDRSLGHELSEMDGKTTVITRAAQKAAGRGIVVFACAGNERNVYVDEWGNPDRTMTLLFPSDGDSVITVGNVQFNGDVNPSSSLGPTADGRIKPDIAAPGSGVRTVYGSANYASVYGTSFSTPISAGVGALLLQMHPDWDPIDVRTALRASGSQWMRPDIYMGWGTINAAAASRADSAVFGQVRYDSAGVQSRAEGLSVSVLDGDGETVAETLTSPDGWFRFLGLPAGDHTVRVAYGDSIYDQQVTIPSPPEEVHFLVAFPVSVSSEPGRPSSLAVGPAIPNPANPATSFRYQAPEGADAVTVTVFSLSGQKVYTHSAQVVQSSGEFTWHGRDSSGRPAGSGAYLVRFSADGTSNRPVWRRVVIVR